MYYVNILCVNKQQQQKKDHPAQNIILLYFIFKCPGDCQVLTGISTFVGISTTFLKNGSKKLKTPWGLTSFEFSVIFEDK